PGVRQGVPARGAPRRSKAEPRGRAGSVAVDADRPGRGLPEEPERRRRTKCPRAWPADGPSRPDGLRLHRGRAAGSARHADCRKAGVAAMIQPVESLEITVLVDNATDSLSTNPGFVETERAGGWRRGMKWLSGRCLCCAAHGLSCLITTRTPSSRHTLLFDTGPDESVFERNVIRLGVDLGGVDAMVLSHGHWDHAAAIPRALQMITLANGGRREPTYMHPHI